MDTDDTINILGAGISGLSAAIILKKNGYDVNVYEKQKTVGTRFNNDWQGIENWSEKIDVLKQIESYGIDVDFEYKPLEELNVHYKNFVKTISVKNGCYLVRRGKDEGCLEVSLLKQALELGVNINFGTDSLKMDFPYSINSTGPKEASALVRGIKFNTNSSNAFHMAFSKNIACGFYSYLLIIDGHGTIATVFNKNSSRYSDIYMKNTIELFSDFLNVDEVLSGNKFAGYGYFDIKKNLHDENGALLVGEAGGFQDYLWGFGMRYAIQTAHFASRSIIDGVSYEELIRRNLVSKMKHSLRNRRIFEALGPIAYQGIYYLMTRSKNPLKFLNLIYK